MQKKEHGLLEAFSNGKLSRRDLVESLIRLGIKTPAIAAAMNTASSQVLASDFNWKKHQGTRIHLLLNQHPYTDALLANLKTFQSMTGITVTHDIYAENIYFDKVTAALSSGSHQYDAIMTGAYMTWTYGPSGWLADLNEWIHDPEKTAPNYQWDDILPGLRASTAWSGRAGDILGSDGAKQWCLPWAYELNNISYNKEMLEKTNLSPPTDMQDLIEISSQLKTDLNTVYGIGTRGTRSWATIHPGFLSAYANFGQRDFSTQDNGKLKAAMNTPESIEFHRLWVEMIQKAGPQDWESKTWYQVAQDFGEERSAMIFDADIIGYFMNDKSHKTFGKVGYSPFAANPDASAPTPNVWIWSLAMPTHSKQKDAAWYFMQWASGSDHAVYGARGMDFVNPVRKSVWGDEYFRQRLETYYPGYVSQHEISAPGAKIYFTPQPLFFDLTTQWAEMLQKMVAKSIPVDEALDQLAHSINQQLEDHGLS